MTHVEIPPLTWSIVSGALLIFLLWIIDVSMGTFRMISITRGQRKTAAVLGFAEVTI